MIMNAHQKVFQKKTHFKKAAVYTPARERNFHLSAKFSAFYGLLFLKTVVEYI
jgi:hypothetical protein